MKISIVTACLLCFVMVHGVSAAMDEPWSVNPESPVIKAVHPGEAQGKWKDTGMNPLIMLLRSFREHVSPVDGPRCTLYPTCSAYAEEATTKHGTLMGLILTADRLLHEFDEPDFAPPVVRFGSVRYFDPVENNDFWWSR